MLLFPKLPRQSHACAQKRHGVWTCPTCKHQPFSPLGLATVAAPQQQQQGSKTSVASPRKGSIGSVGDSSSVPLSLLSQGRTAHGDAEQPNASYPGDTSGARSAVGGGGGNASRLSTPPSSPMKGSSSARGGDVAGRNRSSSVGSGSALADGAGDGGGGSGGGGDSSRRTGRQRVAKSFGDEFDEVRLNLGPGVAGVGDGRYCWLRGALCLVLQ